MLDRITITGADNSIRPEDLLPLSQAFPFCEFGILASATNVSSPRFPSADWIAELQDCARSNPMKLSLHLCGRWVRQILIGELNPVVLQFMNGFARIQLNFRSEMTECVPESAMESLAKLRFCSRFGADLEFIFQLDGERGNEHLEDIALEYVNTYGEPCNMVGLFDASGGRGIVPSKWPAPMYHADGVYDYHGYAGGLGPDNLAEQLPLIAKAAGDTRFWIDMESGVRSADDRQFDLDKVLRCLQIAAKFIEGQK